VARLRYYSHPTALVESTDIGEGTRIWAFTHILKGAVIGRNCNIGDHCYIESGVIIGNNVTVKNGNALWEGVNIADNSFIGPYVVFINDLYPRSRRSEFTSARYKTKNWLLRTFIEEGASLGSNSTILCGKRIGKYALVGAGAVVTEDVCPFSLVYGNPARMKGYVCKCGNPLKFSKNKAVCKKCQTEYIHQRDEVVEI
jgi:acetyltransferase-like isoleucine patch superfamily enzyme